MENAVDALKISFAVFIFVFAIAIAFSVISKAKTTGDVVLYYSDKTNFYEMQSSSGENREVGLAEVIAALYRSIGESMVVTIYDGNTEITDRLYIKNNGVSGGLYSRNTWVSEEEINNFIKREIIDKPDKYNQTTKFKEEFVEVQETGEYKTGEDGSEITVSGGSSKIYITYYRIENP